MKVSEVWSMNLKKWENKNKNWSRHHTQQVGKQLKSNLHYSHICRIIQQVIHDTRMVKYHPA